MSNDAATVDDAERAGSPLPEELRLQDAVARMARINMRDTVRVLRALHYLWEQMDCDGAKILHQQLLESATQDSLPAPLHAKPAQSSIQGCNRFWEWLQDVDPDHQGTYDHIFELDDDPFMFENMKQVLGTRTAISVIRDLKSSSKIDGDQRPTAIASD